MAKWRFEVRWDGEVMSFQEVSGLNSEAPPVEYRSGNLAGFRATRMPGPFQRADVTLRRGVLTGDNARDWINRVRQNQAARATVVISLLDDDGRPTTVWTLARALPGKVTGVDFNATGTDVAIDTLEISHEGLTIANG